MYLEKVIPRSNHDWRVGISLLISTGKLFINGVYIYGDTGVTVDIDLLK